MARMAFPVLMCVRCAEAHNNGVLPDLIEVVNDA